MRYVKQILLPGEHVLCDGHVHPVVLFHGMLVLAVAALLLHEAANTGGGHSYILNGAYRLGEWLPFTQKLYRSLYHWQQSSPSTALEIKVVALILAVIGFVLMMRGWITMSFTELIITDRRIIAKYGVTTVTTIEMDRRRVAGVIISQSLWGRFVNYGYILIQGFTTNIGGLPPMAHPHMLQQYLNAREM